MNILRYIILGTLVFLGFPANAQITFIADTTEGCDSLRVTFIYRNTDFIDTVTTVDWDFGNGTISTGKEQQTVLYDTAGSYTVTMLINGNTPLTRPGYIRVHSTPGAGFVASDSLELGSFSVVFIAASQPVDSIPYSYHWLLDDGTTGENSVLVHSFQQAGEYQARLRVNHPFGCSDQRTRRVEVRDSLDCPNVFTPNDDGINDVFLVKTNGVTIYSMQVFSRSGVLVYKSEAPILIWDGRNLSGQELLPGIYYYVIQPAGGSSGPAKKGFVNLYR